jgi:protein-arginine kinase activator protein McsA
MIEQALFEKRRTDNELCEQGLSCPECKKLFLPVVRLIGCWQCYNCLSSPGCLVDFLCDQTVVDFAIFVQGRHQSHIAVWDE